MTKREFLELAGKVWDECDAAVTKAPRGQVVRMTEGVFREKFIVLAGRAAEVAYQKRGDNAAFSPSVQMRAQSDEQRSEEKSSLDYPA